MDDEDDFYRVMMLLLSRFSRVRLCATPETAAHQAPPYLGFSRQEHWRGCHFLLQCMKVKSESEVTQSCLTLRNPMDCRLPGFSVHGIFQATVLEWDAIAFSVYRVIDNDKVRTDYSQAICFSKFLWLIWCGDSEVTKIESSVSDSMCPSNLFYFYFFALHTWAATAGEKSELGALLPARTQEKW